MHHQHHIPDVASNDNSKPKPRPVCVELRMTSYKGTVTYADIHYK